MSLQTWVRDQLIDILGFSEQTIVDFVIAIAKKAKDTSSLVDSLQKCDLPVNDKTKSFASELLSRVPKGGAPSTASTQVSFYTNTSEFARKLVALDEQFR